MPFQIILPSASHCGALVAPPKVPTMWILFRHPRVWTCQLGFALDQKFFVCQARRQEARDDCGTSPTSARPSESCALKKTFVIGAKNCYVSSFHGVSFAFVVLTANLIWWRIRSTSSPGFIPTAHRAGLADCDHVPHQPEVHEIHPSVDQRRICGIPGSS